MLRGEDVLCGTSTTGTGTLTLAAQPSPPGGADFYHWLTATGLNFVNGNAVLVSYTIIEYTTSGFTTQSQMEKGIGTLTLGASLTASTLARTTVQTTATSLNGTAAYNVSAPTAITIGTAANTLVFVGASAADIPAVIPYFENSANDTLGVMPASATAATSNNNLTSGTDIYRPFLWLSPMLVKRCSLRVQGAYTGGTNNAYARIYATNTTGRPGKLLYDFGAVGPANSALNSASTNISSGAAGNGYLLTPGVYWMNTLAIFTGGSGTPQFLSHAVAFCPGLMGSSGLGPVTASNATSGNATAPDPANVTGYSVVVTNTAHHCFALKDS